jgi:hypothetical protein
MRISNKEMLQGLVQTLTDEECKEVYYLLTGKDRINPQYIYFDRVKLTNGQYNKLVWAWGKEKTSECIKILNDWLIKKGDNVSPYMSHYKSIMGWVEYQYYRTHPANDKSLRFNSTIDTAWKAKKYIQRIPPELRAYDSEVKFLVDKFGTEILK